MRTLTEALDLAAQCHLAWLDPEREFFPTGGYEVAHDTGRWWDAMLRLEATTGFAIPAPAETAMRRNLHCLMDNPDGLLMSLPDAGLMGKPAFINPHNFREGLLALGALVRFRDDTWARAAGHRLLMALDRCFQPDGRLDYTRLACWGRVPLTRDPCHDQPPDKPWFDATANSGRALEAIVGFYEATDDPLALDVASRIARHHLLHTVHADGAVRAEIIAPGNVGHNHSYLGTLRGLLLYGLLTRQHEYVDAVNATYRRALWPHHITESGWTPHDLGRTRFPNAVGEPVAETASCGDVAQLALWLALDAGQYELLDDVERLVRARLLPEQITAADLEDPANAGAKLGPRQLGGWGVHGAPYGKGCILDVLAAVAHSLADIHSQIVTRGDLGLVVNLHFTAETPDAEVVSERGREACLTVRPRVAATAVAIRVPGWVPRDSLRLNVGGRDMAPRHVGPFVLVGVEELSPGAVIVLRHALPERETSETLPGGRTFRLRWRGDEVVGVHPREVPLAIHPPWDAAQKDS